MLCLLRHYRQEAYATVEEEALYGPLETSEGRGTEPEPMVRLFADSGIDASYRHGDVTLADLERAVDGAMLPIVDLQAWRDDETPWEQTWDAGHYVIMVGYDEELLFFADPSTMTPEGYAYLPRAELDERWHDLAGPEDTRLRRMAIFTCGPHDGRTWAGDAARPREAVRLG